MDKLLAPENPFGFILHRKMSVQLNYSTSTEYELIEYPGLVKNTDNMVKTLGGINKISRVSFFITKI